MPHLPTWYEQYILPVSGSGSGQEDSPEGQTTARKRKKVAVLPLESWACRAERSQEGRRMVLRGAKGVWNVVLLSGEAISGKKWQ
jgi:hypothetical protein